MAERLKYALAASALRYLAARGAALQFVVVHPRISVGQHGLDG